MIHSEPHPLAGAVVKVTPLGAPHQELVEGADFRIEDYWDRVSGRSWGDSVGNIACINYATRMGLAGGPSDDEVVYGKINGLGYLVHVSELSSE